MADLPAVQDPKVPVHQIPSGKSLIHERADSAEIWRLCCRLRLDMRENGLGIKDAQLALSIAYPDLKIGLKELKTFMEEYVDTAVVLEPSFFKNGLMRATGRLNAVVEAANIAERMQEAFENAVDSDDVKPEDLPRYMLAGERAQKARIRQYEMMDKVGMGAQSEKDRATPAKGMAAPPPIHIEHAEFNLSEAVGGTFARRAAIDAEGKSKTPA